jgi:aspartyl-tRNA(Asn)/glutamyl-tRNA(Gln) amidotransferase subunit A
MGLASVGTDTGGSIRIPAAACGLVGIKPAHGDVPVDGVVPLSSSLDHVGPLAVTVQDAAWMLALLSGRRPWRVREIPASGVRLRRLRGDFEDPVSDEVREAFDRSMRALQAAGAVLTDGTIDGTAHIAAAYTRIVLAEAAAWHARYLDERPGDYTPIVRERLEHGRTVPAVDYLEAQAFRRTLRASVDRALEGVDALVLPTLPIVAPPLGAEVIVVGANATDVPVRAAMLKHTQPFNMTGHPAVTVPAPAPGLPVGIQLVAAADRTPRLLEIAAVCERLLTS